MSSNRIIALLVSCVALLVAGCSLVTNIDRTEIEDGTGGSAGASGEGEAGGNGGAAGAG